MTSDNRDGKCTMLAHAKRYWPGKAMDEVCVIHALQSEKVSKVMGFHLVIEKLEPDELSDTRLCCCSALVEES